MNTKTRRYVFICSFLTLLVVGIICDCLYQTSPNRVINLPEFQSQLRTKEEVAIRGLYDVRDIYTTYTIDSLANYSSPSDEDISYYIIEEGEIVFWSNNHLVIDDFYPDYYNEWEFVELPNAYCIAFLCSWDDVDYLALVTIKHNYSYENDKLINRYASGFDLDKRVGICWTTDGEVDEYPIYSNQGQYLFSLEEPDEPIYKETWSVLSSLAYFFSIVFLFIAYACFPLLIGKRNISIKTFLFLLFGVGVAVFLLLYFNIPTTLFTHELFLPYHYSYGPLLASILHLTIFTGYIFSSVCLFCFFVKVTEEKGSLVIAKDIFLQSLYPFYFIVFYLVLHSLVFHSTIKMPILHVNDINLLNIWGHFLFFIWGIGFVLLFFKTHNFHHRQGLLKRFLLIDLVLICVLSIFFYWLFSLKPLLAIIPYLVLTISFYFFCFLKKTKNKYFYFLLWSILCALFVSVNLIQLDLEKSKEKYHVLAQNIFINGNVENDRIADALLKELDLQLSDDEYLWELMSNLDSLEIVKDYLDDVYFRGFWNKYDVRLNVEMQSSVSYSEYIQYTEHIGAKIRDTHFYSVPTTQNAMTYIGIFPGIEIPSAKDSAYYYMEFYPRRQYRSYSFPDLLIPSSVDVPSYLNVPIAKYDNGLLTYSSGKMEYPNELKEAFNIGEDYKVVTLDHLRHYVYRPNDETTIVISNYAENGLVDYIQLLIYLTLSYFVLAWLAQQIYRLLFKRKELDVGLAARFQYMFISLFIISFIAIFYVSVDFIKVRYQKQQIAILESKRNYIQEALQDKYYWNQELDMRNTNALNFDLQDLSYTYQTDIHVFDNNGILLGSSQPLIFYRNLISDRMASKPCFLLNPNIEQYENIGDLVYLVAYTDFYNWDYLNIGYIAVPQFFSQEDMKAEIESFSSMIIHIYLIVIIIAVLLAVFIGRRLSAPLNMLESKLKEMRIGRRNEKIEYRQNDEIGHLVAQYNRTVDELEQSARLLAKSERESAWKTMARQVAHEINNPLTPMKLSIQHLQRSKGMNDEGFDKYFKESTDMLIEQIDSLSRIATTFSNFARMPDANISRIDIDAALQSAVRLFANNSRQIKVLYDGGKDVTFVYADSEQIAQVFNNLIKNAMQAIPNDRVGLILISLRSDSNAVFISVTDNGMGINIETQDKVFIPNFTTKAKGMGLGLAISKNIIEQIGGTITFETIEGKGSTFIVEIPKG